MFKKTFVKLAILPVALMPLSAVSAPFDNGKAVFVGTPDTPVTGDFNLASRTMTVDPWLFFGNLVTTTDVELLDPGLYSKPGGDFEVPPGHIGASMLFNWNGNSVDSVMVWEVTPTGTSDEYRAIDSDDDGIPGHAFTNGPFLGATFYYEFDAVPGNTDPDPGVFVTLSVDGGPVQECSSDLSADVTVNANPNLIGDAELDDVFWTVDGETSVTGLSITENLSLGSHVIEATALTTTGETDETSISVVVQDTIRPIVNVDFISKKGRGEVIDVENEIASPGKYQVSVKITDSCDPDPVISHSEAREVTLIDDGDIIKITNKVDNLKLSKSGVTVQASGHDTSGNNSISVSKTLKLE
jgi:hypothetical protein